MKRYLFYILAVLSICVSALADGRIGKMVIAGQECEYDTLVHRKIGPGATYTQFQFYELPYNGINYKMRAHVVQVDNTNSNNAIKPYIAKGIYYKVNTQVQEVKLEKQNGLKPISSISGLGWHQSNTTSKTRKPYELDSHFVRDNVVWYSDVGKQSCFYIDSENIAHIEDVQLSSTLQESSGVKITIGQINHCRDLADEYNLATLFCNGMKSWSNADDEGTDVLLTVLSNEGKIVKGTNHCQVESILDGCGHTPSSNECIVSIKNKDIETLLQQLQENEFVDISVEYTDKENHTLDCSNLCYVIYSYAVKEGKVSPWNLKNAAFPGIGTSKDGKTTYLFDVEISPYSNAPCDCMSYLLQNIGVYTAKWMDGGPSAEMTVDGEWVTINSIGYGFNGRYIPGGIMLYSTAPDDNNITEIELSDPTARSIYVGQTLEIPTYAYNQYGEMIQKDAEKTDKIELSCTNDLGTFSNGVFTATKAGDGSITVKVAGTDITKSIPITVSEHRVLTANPENLFTGEGRECQLTLSLTDSEGTHEIKPEDAVWTTNSKYVIRGCTNGRIVPMVDGKADVYVTYDGLCDTVNVTVENLETEVDYLDLTDNVEDKKSPDIQLPSVPHSFTASIKGEPGSIVSLYYTLGSGYVCTQPDTISEDSTVSIHVALDYDGLTTYPVNIVNLTSSSKTETPVLTALIAYYTADADGINEIATDLPSSSRSHSIYSLTGQRLSQMQRGINIVNRRKVVAERER